MAEGGKGGWREFTVHARWYGKVVEIRFFAWQGQSLAENGKEVGGLSCLSCGVLNIRFLVVKASSFESPRRALSNDGRPRLRDLLLEAVTTRRVFAS